MSAYLQLLTFHLVGVGCVRVVIGVILRDREREFDVLLLTHAVISRKTKSAIRSK